MKPIYLLILLTLALVLGVVLVPLMDNDAAHHAVVAMEMVRQGDYTTLTDVINGSVPYFDKPHLQFWLLAGSYKLLGVSDIVYKLSSLLFVVLTLFSTYKLCERLFPGRNVGITSVLVLFSMMAFMLGSSVDIRMDAILSGAVIFAIWQGVVCVDSDSRASRRRPWGSCLGLALGLALAFSCKGIFGVVIVGVTLLFYMIGTHRLRWILSLRFLSVILLFGVLILPELWAFYDQFGWDGVRFILYEQVLIRTGGGMGEVSATDPLFFVHTLLWTVLPWSALLFFFTVRSLLTQKFTPVYWLTVPGSVLIIVMLSFSSFKLPHYLNPLFALMAIFVAAQLCELLPRTKIMRGVAWTQKTMVAVMLIVLLVVNYWLFMWSGLVVAIAVSVGVLWLLVKLFKPWDSIDKIVSYSVVGSALLWIALNVNFYPQLLSYQAGNVCVDWCEERNIKAEDLYLFAPQDYSGSLDVGHGALHDQLTLDQIAQKSASDEHFYVFVEQSPYETLKSDTTLRFSVLFSTPDYRVTRLVPKFLNPSTRRELLDTARLLEFKR